MRKLYNIATTIFSVIIIIFAVLFIIIEGRIVFSLDWLTYDNSFNGLIRHLLRLILSILVLGVSILEIVNTKLNNENIFFYLVYFDLGLVLASLVILVFAANYIGIISVIFMSLMSLLKLYYYVLVYKNSSN